MKGVRKRLLVINPNTSQSVTALVERHVRRLAPPHVEIVPATGRFGSPYISDEASYAVGAHAALDCWERHREGVDGVLLACFGDPGYFALQESCGVPVVALAESTMRAAAARAGRFGIVTGGERWPAMLERHARALGLSHALAGVWAVGLTGGEIAANPAAALAALREACLRAQSDGAGEVILAGAGLAGIAAGLAPLVDVPLVDSVEAGTLAALAALGCGPPRSPAD